MARQFSGSARGKGFSPASFNNAAERRIEEQTSAQIKQMRAFQKSDMDNRERVVKDMEANARATQEQLSRDQKIESSNAQTLLNQNRYDEDAARANYRNGVKSTAAVFEEFAKFSKTASGIAEKINQNYIDEEWNRGVRDRQMAGATMPGQVEYDGLVAADTVAQAEMDGSLTVAAAQGADRLAVQKARGGSRWYNEAWNRTGATMTAKTQWPVFRETELANSEEMVTVVGPDGSDQSFMIKDATGMAQKAAAIAQLQQKFFKQNGWTGNVSPYRLGPALDFMQESNTGWLQQQANLEITRSQNQLKNQAYGQFSPNNTGPWSENDATDNFNVILQNNNGDYQKTWNVLIDGVQEGNIDVNKLALLRDPRDGKLISDPTSIANNRFRQLQMAAETRRLDEYSLEQKQKKMQRQKMEQDWRALLNDDPSAGNLEKAAEAFRSIDAPVPDWIQRRIKNNDPSGTGLNQALIDSAKDALARGTLTQERIDEIYESNPVEGRQLQEAYDKQNPYAKDKTYAEMLKSLEGLTKDLGSSGTPNSAKAQLELEGIYKTKVDGYVAGGMSIADASKEAANDINKLMAEGRGNPDHQYYRKHDAATGSWSWPNLVKNPSVTEEARARSKTIMNALSARDSKGVRDLLSQRDSIYNDTELKRITDMYDASPGAFTMPADIQLIARKLDESPMTVLNTLLDTAGLPQIKPPPSMQLMDEASPEARRLLQQHRSAYRSIRGLTRTANSSGQWNSASISPEYVPMIDTSASAYNVPPAYIAAMADIESSLNPNNISYNGSSYGMMMINKDAHPLFFQQNNWRDPQANIDYGTQYLAQMLNLYDNDPVAAAMAYNAGPGNYDKYLRGELPDGPIKTEMLNHGRKFAKALLKYEGASSGMLASPMTIREGPMARSFTGALTYAGNRQAYRDTGNFLQDELGFKVAEQADFGGTAPVHASDSYHNYDEAFDVTHWKGTRLDSIEKTELLKERIRVLGLFEEIIGPGDGDPKHETHLHLGGLMRPMTAQDKAQLKALFD